MRVMNYLTYIFATYTEVKVNKEEEEKNIVLQVLGESGGLKKVEG